MHHHAREWHTVCFHYSHQLDLSLRLTGGLWDRRESASKARRVRRYLVACDLSEESVYAIEWAIGTVLRDGDEAIVVSVIETDTKCALPSPPL